MNNWGSGFVPIIIYSSFSNIIPIPPTDEFWVAAVTLEQMITPGGEEYIFIG